MEELLLNILNCFQVSSAANGSESIYIRERIKTLPDMILLDIYVLRKRNVAFEKLQA